MGQLAQRYRQLLLLAGESVEIENFSRLTWSLRAGCVLTVNNDGVDPDIDIATTDPPIVLSNEGITEYCKLTATGGDVLIFYYE